MRAAGAAAGLAFLVGCGNAASGGTGVGPSTAVTTGHTRTVAPRTTPPIRHASTPVPTPVPTPVEGDCPYLGVEDVAGTVGQHIARSTVTPTRPYPGCDFYRPNGERAVDIDVAVLRTSTQAQARAIAIGGRAANPVNGIADGGVVTVTNDGAVLAVSKGRTLVVVRINQRSSLEAKEIARAVIGGLP
jgi:hypothetical protein